MNYRSVRIALLGTLGVGLALSQQACGNGTSAAASATSSPTAAATSSAASAPAATASAVAAATTKPASSGVKKCTDADVKVEVTWQPQAEQGNTRMGLVAVTNKSAASCTVNGRATLVLTNAADEAVTVPTKKVDEPGPATAITLKPGTTAFQGAKWTTCDKGDESCPTGNGLRYTLTTGTATKGADLIDFPDPTKSNLTMKSLQVGTLQPITSGVVAW